MLGKHRRTGLKHVYARIVAIRTPDLKLAMHDVAVRRMFWEAEWAAAPQPGWSTIICVREWGLSMAFFAGLPLPGAPSWPTPNGCLMS
jgi:hypothetical protein